MIEHHVQKLLELATERKHAAIYDILNNFDEKTKGLLFEIFLVKIFAGIGWISARAGGRHDKGADILLSHPKTPHQISLIVQVKNHKLPLSFDDTKIELVKFEEKGRDQYNCNQFLIISLNSYVKDAQALTAFNLLLRSWNYVCELIDKYDPFKSSEPEFELYAHNEQSYIRLKDLWKHKRNVAAVQATGTGKSFLIAKALIDFINDPKLVLAPSRYILQQQQKRCVWVNPKTTYMTYAKAARLTEDEVKRINPRLIVLDEFHRCGAEEWGRGVNAILHNYPDAFIFGTSATPIRHLDNSRDMSDELFDGNLACNLSLAEAIVKRILQPPKYVTALYTLEEESARLKEDVAKSSKSDDEKEMLFAEINTSILDWEKSSGIPSILKKHLPSDLNKIIVFCRDRDHLNTVEWLVMSWFQKAAIGNRRKSYIVAHDEPNSQAELTKFRQATSRDTIHLLFCIDMLNEGLHIEDVGAVILLRTTESPRIFYQQIGRCLHVDSVHSPIVFDFVNNFSSIRASDFLSDLNDAKEVEQLKRERLGLKENCPPFTIIDECKDILDVFESIQCKLETWEVMFENLKCFIETHGHSSVPRNHEFMTLSHWATAQRSAHFKKLLPGKNVNRLNSINFDWNPVESRWIDNYQKLIEYKLKHGNAHVPQRLKEFKSLGSWAKIQRIAFKGGYMPEEKIKLLEEIGFNWKVRELDYDNVL